MIPPESWILCIRTKPPNCIYKIPYWRLDEFIQTLVVLPPNFALTTPPQSDKKYKRSVNRRSKAGRICYCLSVGAAPESCINKSLTQAGSGGRSREKIGGNFRNVWGRARHLTSGGKGTLTEAEWCRWQNVLPPRTGTPMSLALRNLALGRCEPSDTSGWLETLSPAARRGALILTLSWVELHGAGLSAIKGFNQRAGCFELNRKDKKKKLCTFASANGTQL